MAESVEVLIVGGGIAGLSTAMHLARAGVGPVTLVDRELTPGFYASGHNAAIARQLTGRAEHTALAVEGRNRLAEAGLLAPAGGLLLAMDGEGLDGLEREAAIFGVPTRRGEGAGLEGLHARQHLAIPSDGVIDIHGLLGHCARTARDAGVRLRYGCELKAVEASPGGFEVATSEGDFRAAYLVNAAGAWAGPLGRMAGGLDLGLRPLRRHLAWGDGDYPPEAPYAWWVDRPFYLRPESGGVLLCPCDEAEVAPPRPAQQPDTDPEALAGLGATLLELAPGLVDCPIARAWCGLRTFAPDRRFAIGFDPVNPRLFWVAGLGGHGMTSGLAVGRLAAERFRDRADHALAPGRFRP